MTLASTFRGSRGRGGWDSPATHHSGWQQTLTSNSRTSVFPSSSLSHYRNHTNFTFATVYFNLSNNQTTEDDCSFIDPCPHRASHRPAAHASPAIQSHHLTSSTTNRATQPACIRRRRFPARRTAKRRHHRGNTRNSFVAQHPSPDCPLHSIRRRHACPPTLHSLRRRRHTHPRLERRRIRSAKPRRHIETRSTISAITFAPRATPLATSNHLTTTPEPLRLPERLHRRLLPRAQLGPHTRRDRRHRTGEYSWFPLHPLAAMDPIQRHDLHPHLKSRRRRRRSGHPTTGTLTKSAHPPKSSLELPVRDAAFEFQTREDNTAGAHCAGCAAGEDGWE